MCGSATLATLVSSTSMKVASITVPAITQGFIGSLMSGGSGVSAGMPAGVRRSTTSVCRALAILRLQRELLGKNGRFDIHSRTQHLIASRDGIEHDLHRNSLDHFDVVA